MEGLLLLDPWRDEGLTLDHVVHNVLGCVDERVVDAAVTDGGGATGDILSGQRVLWFGRGAYLELSTRNGVLDASICEGL